MAIDSDAICHAHERAFNEHVLPQLAAMGFQERAAPALAPSAWRTSGLHRHFLAEGYAAGVFGRRAIYVVIRYPDAFEISLNEKAIESGVDIPNNLTVTACKNPDEKTRDGYPVHRNHELAVEKNLALAKIRSSIAAALAQGGMTRIEAEAPAAGT